MLNPAKAYNIRGLFDLIRDASAEDVQALLNNDRQHASPLCDAIIQFRKDHAPCVLLGREPRMHFNYATLQLAYEQYADRWDELHEASGGGWAKLDLAWRMIIGFLQRRLPGIDRCIAAQGLYYVAGGVKEAVNRSVKLKNSAGDFPVASSDDSLEGLGSSFAVDIGQGVDMGVAGWWRAGVVGAFSKLMSSKNIELVRLMQRPQPHTPKRVGCTLL